MPGLVIIRSLFPSCSLLSGRHTQNILVWSHIFLIDMLPRVMISYWPMGLAIKAGSVILTMKQRVCLVPIQISVSCRWLYDVKLWPLNSFFSGSNTWPLHVVCPGFVQDVWSSIMWHSVGFQIWSTWRWALLCSRMMLSVNLLWHLFWFFVCIWQ